MGDAGKQSWRQRMARFGGLRALRRLHTNQDGGAAVEFSLLAVPFFLVLFAIFETGLFLWGGQALDSATSGSARLILTGQAQNQGLTRDQFKADLCSRIVGLVDCEGGVLLDVKTYASWNAVDVSQPVDASGNITVNGQNFDTGGPGSIVVVRAVYKYPILVRSFGLDLSDLPGGNRLLVSTVAFQNEPYATTSSTQ